MRHTNRTNDPIRKVDPASGRDAGVFVTIREQWRMLLDELDGLEYRLRSTLTDGEPACVFGRKVFSPESSTFLFDFSQNGVSSVKSQYVLRDGVTYDIPIAMTPPGFFVARFLQVTLHQRLFVPSGAGGAGGAYQVQMLSGSFFATSPLEPQTRKFSFPDNTSLNGQGLFLMRRMNFLWNMLDRKSNYALSDEMLSDQLLLPQGLGTPALALGTLCFAPENGRFEFDTPWLFERDGEATFQFRPITPVIQPTADSGYTPYTFEDREPGLLSRDSSVTVEVALHGTRYTTMRDLMNRRPR